MGLKEFARNGLNAALDMAPLRGAAKFIATNDAIIFMMHRFEQPELGVEGHDPDFLRDCLDYLRRRRFNLVSVEQIVTAARAGNRIKNAVSFTVDDGYLDHALVGASVFAEYECPATFFLITDFVDGSYWPCDAKIAYILRTSARNRFEWQQGTRSFAINLETPEARKQSVRAMVWATKATAVEQLEADVADLAGTAGVELPALPPPGYRPMTWQDARRIEAMGMRLGAHSCRHVLLRAESDEVAEREIRHSVAKVASQVQRSSPIFCYPTGRYSDFGERDKSIAQATGCIGAVSAEPGYFNPRTIGNYGGYYSIPRFGMPANLEDFRQTVLYIEKMKSAMRNP